MIDASQSPSFSINSLIRQIQQEPVLFQGVVQTTLALGMSFGLGLSVNQVGTITAVSAAILSFITRKNVTPTVNPKDSGGNQLAPKF
jgi:hypothetical protein